MDDENITLRKKQKKIQNKIYFFHIFGWCNSYEHAWYFTIRCTNAALREEINNLRINLKGAHQEIKNLLSDNMQFKSDLEKTTKIMELYKKVNSAEVKCYTPDAKSKIQKKTRLGSLTSTSVKNPKENTSCLLKQMASSNKETQTSNNQPPTKLKARPLYQKSNDKYI